MTPEHTTPEDIAARAGKSVQTIHNWARAESWPVVDIRPEGGRGRPRRAYVIDGLPAHVRRLYNNDAAHKNGGAAPPTIRTAGAVAGTTAAPPDSLHPPHPAAALSFCLDAKALAKADLARLYGAHLDAAGFGDKVRARQDFMLAYNSGLAYPALFAALGRRSWKTIEAWRTALKKSGGDPAALKDGRGKPATGNGAGFTPEQEDILRHCILHPNRLLISEVIRMAKAVMKSRGISNGYSDAAYRRWIYDWRDRNEPMWVFHRHGETAWNDEMAYYIERDYSLINVGDILVADGHILNFETINPWTGKPKRMALILWYDMKSNYPCGWEIMPTEDTAAITSALRRALLTLGKIPKVVYLDNGRAFRARFFEGCPSFEEAGLAGLYERLGCKPVFAWPYHGQSKTIERFFRSFGELERWLPTYSGTAIETKPPRMNRGERLHRRLYEASPHAGGITLADAHRAVAAWFDEYAGRPQKGHLDGAAPIELFEAGRGPGLIPEDLTMLMMSMEIRHVRRNGIHFMGRNYYAPELYGRRRPVVIRYDLQDDSALHVCEPDGAYLCLALPVEKVHPAAHALGTEADQERLRQQIEMKQRQKKEASRHARELLVTEIMPAHERRMEALGLDGAGGKQKTEPGQIRQIGLSAADRERIAAEAAALESEAQDGAEVIDLVEVISAADDLLARVSGGMPDADKYEVLCEAEMAGAALTEEHRAFMRYFEMTDGYARYADYYENLRAELQTKWQARR